MSTCGGLVAGFFSFLCAMYSCTQFFGCLCPVRLAFHRLIASCCWPASACAAWRCGCAVGRVAGCYSGCQPEMLPLGLHPCIPGWIHGVTGSLSRFWCPWLQLWVFRTRADRLSHLGALGLNVGYFPLGTYSRCTCDYYP